MLVKFTTNPNNTVTTFGRRKANFMMCVDAIATAAANSTPTVPAFNTSDTTRDTNNDCILEVISNTEAGSWDNTYSLFTNSVTSMSSYLSEAQLLLTKPSGKATWPYYAFGLLAYNYGSFTNSNSYTSGRGVDFVMGAVNNTALTYATRVRNFYSYGTGFSSYSTSVGSKTYISSAYSGNTANQAEYYTPMHCGDGTTYGDDQTYWMAATENYIIIWSVNGITYYGIRDTQQWESAQPDNPPYVYFAYSNRNNPGWADSLAGYHASVAGMAISRLSMSSLTTQTTYHFYNGSRVADTSSPDAISGIATWYDNMAGNTTSTYRAHVVAIGNNIASNYGSNTSYINYYNNTSSARYVCGMAPLFLKYSDFAKATINTNDSGYYNNLNYNVANDMILQDPTTGAYYPSASTIMFKGYGNGGVTPGQGYFGSGGVAKGILKGMMGDKTVITNNLLTESEYTFNGETYIPIWTGNATYSDLFFIRKA